MIMKCVVHSEIIQTQKMKLGVSFKAFEKCLTMFISGIIDSKIVTILNYKVITIVRYIIVTITCSLLFYASEFPFSPTMYIVFHA